MPALNRVEIIGHLGKDPELRYTPSGTAVANFSVATSERWKGDDGAQKEKTEWHNVVLWKRQAELAGEYLKRGSLVYLSGVLRTRKWEDKNGVDRYTTEIHVKEMQFLDKPTANDGSDRSRAGSAPPAASAPSPNGIDFDDDIPF